MSIEKITKEELLKELGEYILSDGELEKISGGGREQICQERAKEKYDSCMAQYNLKSQCEKQKQNTYNACMRA